jgi:hypothetical protein
MIEHEVWRGPNWKQGIKGQRIAIVGYSHHRDPTHLDNNQFTINVVRKFLSDDLARNALFPRVPGYFGYKSREDQKDFWNRVWFFNFIPKCIGEGNQKYATADSNLNELAKKRFEKILQKEKIQKVFVFTAKGWCNCPYTDEEKKGKCCASLGPELRDVTWGTYTFGRRRILAFGFHHPQYANKVHMTEAVSKALSKKVGS